MVEDFSGVMKSKLKLVWGHYLFFDVGWGEGGAGAGAWSQNETRMFFKKVHKWEVNKGKLQ